MYLNDRDFFEESSIVCKKNVLDPRRTVQLRKLVIKYESDLVRFSLCESQASFALDCPKMEYQSQQFWLNLMLYRNVRTEGVAE